MIETPNALLYKPNIEEYNPSVIACFCISDDWNEQSLLKLKEKTDAYFLVGIQTPDSELVSFDIVEGIVECQSEDVSQVVKLLNISQRGLIGIDVNDIKNLFERSRSYKFIQIHITDEFETDMVKTTAHELVDQLPKGLNAEGLLVGMESSESLSIDHTSYIIDFLEKRIVGDELYKYYCTSISDEANSFRLRMIYAEAH